MASEYEEFEFRRKMIIFFLLIGILIIVLGSVYLFLKKPSKSEIIKKNATARQEEKSGIAEQKNNSTGNKSNTTNVSKDEEKFNFDIKSLKDLDSRACFASSEDLFWWFGEPLYPMGWENIDGKRVEVSFKFFLWNETVLYTKGRYNKTTKKVETYEYIAREDVNRTIQKRIDCLNINGAS